MAWHHRVSFRLLGRPVPRPEGCLSAGQFRLRLGPDRVLGGGHKSADRFAAALSNPRAAE